METKRLSFFGGVVPLIRNYSITNDYLKTAWNDRVFPSSNFDILEPDANLGLPVCIRDECVFRVSFLQNELPIHKKTKATALVLISFSIIVLMVIVYRYIKKIPSPEIQLITLYVVFCTCFATEWSTLIFPLTWFVPSSLIHKCLHLQP